MLESKPGKVFSHLGRKENYLIINLTSVIRLNSLMHLQELFKIPSTFFLPALEGMTQRIYNSLLNFTQTLFVK
jgi:hypothetical protein